jgi:hypothetical protein
MNEIAKQAISEKLKKACEEEGLTRETASELLGLRSKHYGGFIASGNPNQWKNVAKKAWEQVRDWTNSGESIVKYSEKIASGVNTIADNSNKSADSAEIIAEDKGISKESAQEIIDFHDYMLKEIKDRENKRTPPNTNNLVPIEINIILKINGREVRI